MAELHDCPPDVDEVAARVRPISKKPLLLIALLATAGPTAHGECTQQRESRVVGLTGCDAAVFAQIPGQSDLFLGRQPLTADGQLAGISGANDCSGGNEENLRTGKIFNRWSLALDRFNWQTRTFTVVKPLMDTSVDAHGGTSQVTITSGVMRGAIVRSAYDPDVVRFHGMYIVSFECTLENGTLYGVEGTSSCLSVYNPITQELDLDRTQVIVSGRQTDATHFTAAAVPVLLVYHERLFIYWCALSVMNGKFTTTTIRGTELSVNMEGISVKGSRGHLIHATDEPITTRVWNVKSDDPLSNSTVNLQKLWISEGEIVAAAGVGGSGCTIPSDKFRGCFRLVLAKAHDPLGRDAFNRGQGIDENELPSNAQEYTRPVRDREGHYWFLGHFVRPEADGFADARPAPAMDFWKTNELESAVVMFPICDRSLWPTK